MTVITILIVASILMALATIFIGSPISKDNVKVYPYLLDVEEDLDYDSPVALQEARREEVAVKPRSKPKKKRIAPEKDAYAALDPLQYIAPPYAEELPIKRWQYRNVGLWSTGEIAVYCARYRQTLREQHARVLAELRSRNNGTKTGSSNS